MSDKRIKNGSNMQRRRWRLNLFAHFDAFLMSLQYNIKFRNVLATIDQCRFDSSLIHWYGIVITWKQRWGLERGGRDFAFAAKNVNAQLGHEPTTFGLEVQLSWARKTSKVKNFPGHLPLPPQRRHIYCDISKLSCRWMASMSGFGCLSIIQRKVMKLNGLIVGCNVRFPWTRPQ